MESFQPGLSFSPLNDRAEMVSRLHGTFSSAELKIQVRATIKSQPGLKQ